MCHDVVFRAGAKAGDRSVTALDDEDRAATLAKATEIAINDAAIIPLHYQVNTWGAKKGLKYVARTDEATLAIGVVKE